MINMSVTANIHSEPSKCAISVSFADVGQIPEAHRKSSLTLLPDGRLRVTAGEVGRQSLSLKRATGEGPNTLRTAASGRKRPFKPNLRSTLQADFEAEVLTYGDTTVITTVLPVTKVFCVGVPAKIAEEPPLPRDRNRTALDSLRTLRNRINEAFGRAKLEGLEAEPSLKLKNGQWVLSITAMHRAEI